MKIHVYHPHKAAEKKCIHSNLGSNGFRTSGAQVKAQLDFPVSSNDRLPVRSGDIIWVDSNASVGGFKMHGFYV